MPSITKGRELMAVGTRVLLDAFLADRDAPSPLGHREPFIGKRIDDLADVDPVELERSIVVVEPWAHVGLRPTDHRGVVASENVAYLADQIMGVQTLIVPAWRDGVGDPGRFAAVVSRAMLVVFEGGEPDVHVSSSFADAYPRIAATRTLVELLLRGVPFMGICLSHQLVAQAHVELIKDAVARLGASGHRAFVDVAQRISEVGRSLRVEKDYGVVATSWDDETFAVAKNEQVSHANTRLYPYADVDLVHVPTIVSEAHRYIARKYEATIDSALQYEDELMIQAFHGNEVSQESARFACWAYQELHRVLSAYKLDAASRPDIQPLMGAPLAVEILASTHREGGRVLCEVAATGTYWERGVTAMTTQFHPELDESLHTASEGWAPDWFEMKQSDGFRLLARMMRACIR